MLSDVVEERGVAVEHWNPVWDLALASVAACTIECNAYLIASSLLRRLLLVQASAAGPSGATRVA